MKERLNDGAIERRKNPGSGYEALSIMGGETRRRNLLYVNFVGSLPFVVKSRGVTSHVFV